MTGRLSIAYIPPPVDKKDMLDNRMNKLEQQMNIIERQMAEQALLRHKLEQLVFEPTRSYKEVQGKVPTSHLKLKEQETDRNDGSDLKQTSNRAVEEIITKRTKEFQQSQAEKAANIKYLTRQREQILKARSRLREKCDMFRSFPLPVGKEVVMKPGYKIIHNASACSPESYTHKLLADIPDAVDRIWTLRDCLYQDYLTKRMPYAGELGIESYLPWQIPDFLMVRRLMEEFIDDFILKHVPSDHIIFERENKIKRLNQQDKDWGEASKALIERSVVKLVAEEILLETTAAMTRDVACEEMQLDAMFRRMSRNMFMKEAEIQAIGHPKGRDPSDPVYDLITYFFNSLQSDRDQRKKGVWEHSQALAQSAVPPPLPFFGKPMAEPPKLSERKSTQKPDKKVDKKSYKVVEHEGNF